MEAYEPDQHSWNHKDMQREESGQRSTRDDRSAQHQFHGCGTYDWDTACDRRSDAKPPVRILIEAQHLPAECHTECHQQKEYANYPGKLSREFISPKEEDLHHVD